MEAGHQAASVSGRGLWGDTCTDDLGVGHGRALRACTLFGSLYVEMKPVVMKHVSFSA